MPIQTIIEASGASDVFGVILSFFSLFASSAIGFLVTQVWFIEFHWKDIDAKLFREVEPLLQDTVGWNPNSQGKDKKVILSTILDYLLISETENNEQKWGYFQRKWDLFHILSGTLWSLRIALILGVIFRLILNWLFFGDLISSISNGFRTFFGNYSPIVNVTDELFKVEVLFTTDVWFFFLTLLVTIIAMLILYYVKKRVFGNYFQMLRIFIFRLEKRPDFRQTIRSVFGDQYFLNN